MPTENELRELLDINERRLAKLKQKRDAFGLHTPDYILVEIDTAKAEIDNLRQQLGLPPLPPEPSFPAIDRQTGMQLSQQPTTEESGSKWWIPIVVALIGLAGVVFVVVWNNPPSPVEPSEEDMQPVEFTYEVHVVSAMGENLPDTHIIIQVGGKAPLDEFTDSNGFARIVIDGTYAREPARLIVEREGFHPYTQEIDLYPDGLPDRIPLEPIEP